MAETSPMARGRSAPAQFVEQREAYRADSSLFDVFHDCVSVFIVKEKKMWFGQAVFSQLCSGPAVSGSMHPLQNEA